MLINEYQHFQIYYQRAEILTQKRKQVYNIKNTLKQHYFNAILADEAERPKQH